MLGRFVMSAAQLDGISALPDWPFAVLADADDSRAATIEAKKIVSTEKPTYCEVSIEQLDELKKIGSFAKIRTGGITPNAIPSIENLASYIVACAERRLAFKATAGLHHPIRCLHALTYDADAPCGTMHGFINVFFAAALAWRDQRGLNPILAETDPEAFQFDDRARWRDSSLSVEEIEEARRSFAHSFGSCSFEEPVEDLRGLGLL
jgi:hypothetical protein